MLQYLKIPFFKRFNFLPNSHHELNTIHIYVCTKCIHIFLHIKLRTIFVLQRAFINFQQRDFKNYIIRK